MATIVDSGKIIPVGRVLDLQPQLMRDGVALNLTGKTVTATFRRESAPNTTLGAAWEDEACTLSNDTYTTAQGGVRITKELLASAFPVPTRATEHYDYIVEFYVVEDDYSPLKLRFGVTLSLKA